MPTPVTAAQRIETLDILRGFAALGILAVNAVAFAWPGSMDTSSATVPFSMDGANRIAVWAVDVFFHNKGRALFSMLFGISVYLVGRERENAARGALLRRRLFILAIFGVVHGLALWFGDILLLYAWSGLFMMLARSWSAKRLVWIGALLLAAFSLWLLAGEISAVVSRAPADSATFARKIAEGQAGVMADVERVRSGWRAAMNVNFEGWLFIQRLSLTTFVVPTVGLMMLGLGLFKTGYLAGRASSRTYGAALLGGLAIVAGYSAAHWRLLDPAQAPATVETMDAVLSELAPFVALAWAALLILMTRHGLGWLTRRLASVGRMAFTNYLTQSLIMTSLFYMPWGPHLYGRVEPAGLWGVVGAIWVAQLIWSPLWLSRFEMGPMEWMWRSLTYGRRMSMVKRA